MLIRTATRNDMHQLCELIKEHASIIDMNHEVVITKESLQIDGFDIKPPLFECFVIYVEDKIDEQLIGYALFYPIYSTWVGNSLMIDDIYIRQSYFKEGAKLMIDKLVKYANETGRNRIDFNFVKSDASIDHFKSFDAENINETESWHNYKFTKEAMLKLAENIN